MPVVLGRRYNCIKPYWKFISPGKCVLQAAPLKQTDKLSQLCGLGGKTGRVGRGKKKTSSVFLRNRVLLFPLVLSVLFLYISSSVKQEGAGVIHSLIKRCGQKGSFKHDL